MTVTSIYYEKCFPLGGYSNEKIGMGVTLTEGDNVIDGFALCKKEVEKAHRFFIDFPNYQNAKKEMADEQNLTPNQMKAYKMQVETFEANYPEYIGKFMPASRKLTNGFDDGVEG